MGLKFVSKVTSNGRHDRTALGRIQDAALVYRGAGERHRQALVHLLPRAAETHDALDVDADAMDLAPVCKLSGELINISFQYRSRIRILARRGEVVKQFLEQFRTSQRPRFYERFIGVASVARRAERFGDFPPRQYQHEAAERISTRTVAHCMCVRLQL